MTRRMTGPGLRGYVQFNKYRDQCEWHRMTRMTGPDCVVMCNLINTYIHTYIHIHTYISPLGKINASGID